MQHHRTFFAFAALALAACSAKSAVPFAPSSSAAAADRRPAASSPLHTLYLFKGGSDGANPYDSLVKVGSSYYGVTYGDKSGPCAYGSVFSISAAGKEHTLYCFGAPPDAENPVGALIDVGGTLYGTSFNGGKDELGTVFAITPAGKERVVYSFQGGTNDGAEPGASLLWYKNELYGTTTSYGGPESGSGMIFALTTGGKERIIHVFQGMAGGGDGQGPYSPPVVVNGMLYGTTAQGGANGYGTVYRAGLHGGEKPIYSFKGAGDGAFPFGSLLLLHGVFYGTAQNGGSGELENGTVFTCTLGGSEKPIYSFQGDPSDGSSPRSGLILVNGTLYGDTEKGGSADLGTLFQITPSGTEKTLYSFTGSSTDGADPFGPLIYDGGTLYGTTISGGNHVDSGNWTGGGTVFRYKI
ncbi:MAG TPA: choice-of-anchor tandem repeat GloVer-containing protein [Candidatus Acidoferrales bacterium]|nr:choice-of-anchor tandem repeat GloVer-containing protein [Candidatus Acidoferrales bacterium]